MKNLPATFFCILILLNFVFAQANNDRISFKGKVGFVNGEDEIMEHKFLDGGKRLLIIGVKNLQIWDVENRQLLHSVQHQIPRFAQKGFFNKYVLLGMTFDYGEFLIDESGKWIITSEKVGNHKLRSAVVRDLQTLKQIAVLETPDISVEYISFDKQNNKLLTFGETADQAALARWNPNNFSNEKTVRINEYEWHLPINDGKKMLVNSEDVNISSTGSKTKRGHRLTLRDAQTGEIEKNYTAENIKPDASFQNTTLSADERFLISKLDNRVFVWLIDGDGKPKFEISNPAPKSDFSLKEIIDRKFIRAKFDKEIRLYNADGGGEPMFSLAPQSPNENLDFVKILNERFVVIKNENKLRVYDTQGGKTTFKYELISDDPKDSVKFYGEIRGGKYFIARDDEKISILETAGDGKPLYEIVRNSENERFPYVETIEDKNFLVVARVNRAEKKPSVSEFYDLTTGKMVFEVPFTVDGKINFTPDESRFYIDSYYSFNIWNLKNKKLDVYPLKVHSESTTDSLTMMTTNTTYRTETMIFSPDYRFLLRQGDNTVSVFDTQSGESLRIVDESVLTQTTKKDKPKLPKYSEAGWLIDGKYIYAVDQNGFWDTARTISFWEIK